MHHTIDGDAGLRNIRRKDNLPLSLSCLLKDELLIFRLQATMQRQDQHRVIRLRHILQGLHSLHDIVGCGQEDKDVPLTRLRQQFLRLANRMVHGPLGKICGAFHVHMRDREGAPWDADHRILPGDAKVLHEELRFDRCRGHNEPEIRPCSAHRLELPEEQVRVDAPLMRLIDDNTAVVHQHLVLDHEVQKALVRGVDHTGGTPNLPLTSHYEAHIFPHHATPLRSHEVGQRLSSHLPRLRADHLETIGDEVTIRQKGQDLRTLAAPSGTDEDHDLVSRNGAKDMTPMCIGRKPRLKPRKLSAKPLHKAFGSLLVHGAHHEAHGTPCRLRVLLVLCFKLKVKLLQWLTRLLLLSGDGLLQPLGMGLHRPAARVLGAQRARVALVHPGHSAVRVLKLQRAQLCVQADLAVDARQLRKVACAIDPPLLPWPIPGRTRFKVCLELLAGCTVPSLACRTCPAALGHQNPRLPLGPLHVKGLTAQPQSSGAAQILEDHGGGLSSLHLENLPHDAQVATLQPPAPGALQEPRRARGGRPPFPQGWLHEVSASTWHLFPGAVPRKRVHDAVGKEDEGMARH
mmetsp:Transcript_55308/g.129011  ORF Transcript_55308/g.129011 Transcript_55308/m.129011 type:complete len:574 (+) Transcript_55308:788-2509(+)